MVLLGIANNIFMYLVYHLLAITAYDAQKQHCCLFPCLFGAQPGGGGKARLP
jgi:hypothetical protein